MLHTDHSVSVLTIVDCNNIVRLLVAPGQNNMQTGSYLFARTKSEVNMEGLIDKQRPASASDKTRAIAFPDNQQLPDTNNTSSQSQGSIAER